MSIFAEKHSIMKAIEIKAKTDRTGKLKIDYDLSESNKSVRVLILYDEEENQAEEEKTWKEYISKNPAFSFLNEPEEDIYSVNDGEALDD